MRWPCRVFVVEPGETWAPSLSLPHKAACTSCLLYTSDAADDLLCVDLGGRRIIKKKRQTTYLSLGHFTTDPQSLPQLTALVYLPATY